VRGKPVHRQEGEKNIPKKNLLERGPSSAQQGLIQKKKGRSTGKGERRAN